jgi:hypothetical protein
MGVSARPFSIDPLSLCPECPGQSILSEILRVVTNIGAIHLDQISDTGQAYPDRDRSAVSLRLYLGRSIRFIILSDSSSSVIPHHFRVILINGCVSMVEQAATSAASPLYSEDKNLYNFLLVA